MKKIILFLAFAISLAGFHPFFSAAQASGNSVSAEEVLKYVNEHRTTIGKGPLIMNDVISKEAETHSRNMASGKVPFSHNGFDGRAARIKKKLKNVNAWAENVAYGANNAKEAVDMWLKSPGHKANMEGPYNLTGIGIAKSTDGSLYFTQIFINRQ